MTTTTTTWSRLIRFVAVETSMVHIGEPVDETLDVGLAYHRKKPIQAREIIGSVFDPNAHVSENILTVSELLAPLACEDVQTVRCLGLNYIDHAKELKLELPSVPELFYKPKTALIGPEAPITIPKVALPAEKGLPDYEVELTIVIGKLAKDVSEEEALNYVLGYTVGNDTTFRTVQSQMSQWGFAKGFDNSTPFGPCIVSTSAIPDPQKLALKTYVNGKLLQDGNTSDQIFTVRKAIAFVSQGTTLEPGSLIMTGTPKGIGYGRNPRIHLQHGDDVRVFIGGGIGTLVNKVKEEGKGISEIKF